jgi:TldD protein
MLDLLVDLVDLAAGRCAYAEARHVSTDDEHLLIRNGQVERVDAQSGEGIGVRVRVGGAWGFAATRDATREGAERALSAALGVARAMPASVDRPMTPLAPARGHWSGPCEIDPFGIPLEDRLELLVAAEAGLHGDERIVQTTSEAILRRQTSAFASSEGAACTQLRVECGGGIQAIAVDGDELQVRSYPSAHGGDVGLGGWERVLALDLAGNAPRVREEVLELLSAPACPTGRRTLVLSSEQLALQVHESIGHALELDRILLGEASYAGTSWVSPTDLGALRYGSEHLTVIADATLPGALGSFGWDDEGVAGGRTTLIADGTLLAALSDRQSASAQGLGASAGCARADGFARQPIVRMTNVSIAPGSGGTIEDLIADTDDGILLETNRAWSIDDRRLHFQFGTEVGHVIRGGELAGLVRNPSYAGITPQFWGSLDAVGSESSWRVHGLLNCGKGEPGQLMRVSHGTAPARFRDVEVGVA